MTCIDACHGTDLLPELALRDGDMAVQLCLVYADAESGMDARQAVNSFKLTAGGVDVNLRRFECHRGPDDDRVHHSQMCAIDFLNADLHSREINPATYFLVNQH